METTHEVDPDGDLLLILRNPSMPLTACVEGHRWSGRLFERDREETIDPVHKQHDSIGSKYNSDLFRNLDPGVNEYSQPPNGPPAEPETVGEEPAPPDSPTEIFGEIRMRLSSRHLILASPYFRKALNGPWAESERIVEAEEWDEAALLITMNIIHGHTRRVPRSVSLETLAKIALITDYYKFHEAIELFTEIWIPKLRKESPSEEFGMNTMFWILVSKVFSHAEVFRSVTAVAQRHSPGRITAPGLPIDEILGEIDQRRQEAVEEVITILHSLLAYLRDERANKCSFTCSSMLFGALTREMASHGLLPRPTALVGFSIEGIANLARSIQTPVWCNDDPYNYYSSERHTCHLSNFIHPLVNGVEMNIRRLELRDD
ncbi:hypothetical protein B0H67DRAFT_256796 [Lasiosphaeris hirsuta]|uniref:BTB domain-containing protein n=1 Tax=Lasiosphaeris hirsuta TaxID=260670 RepID=A0AA40AHT5_9PEZI|nr:hypothetical protein B0H67DRAFT_256796 [Lasiosphaeris hirsuta]